MHRERVISRWLILSGFMAAVGSSYGQQVSTFDAPQSIRTLISGINQQGSFVGNYTDTNNRVHGFLMSNGSFTTIDVPVLGPPNFAYSFAISINSKGDMVVLYYNPAYGPDGLSQYYVLSNGT